MDPLVPKSGLTIHDFSKFDTEHLDILIKDLIVSKHQPTFNFLSSLLRYEFGDLLRIKFEELQTIQPGNKYINQIYNSLTSYFYLLM